MVALVVAGLFTAAGQLLCFIALQKSPANVVAPLISIEIFLFT